MPITPGEMKALGITEKGAVAVTVEKSSIVLRRVETREGAAEAVLAVTADGRD